jgi:hypothetical protein
MRCLGYQRRCSSAGRSTCHAFNCPPLLRPLPFALFLSECAKCVVVECHVHMERHLGDPAEPRGRHNVVAQDEPRVVAELLRWPRHDTLLPTSSVIKANQVERPRDSYDDLDLATDVRLLCNDVAWAKGAPVDDAEASAGCEHSAVCAAHATHGV